MKLAPVSFATVKGRVSQLAVLSLGIVQVAADEPGIDQGLSSETLLAPPGNSTTRCYRVWLRSDCYRRRGNVQGVRLAD